MNLRVSTAGIFERALARMQEVQSRLATAQNQLASGQRMSSAQDNPVAAAAVVALERTEAEYQQFAGNSNVLTHRLSLQENVLAGVNNTMARLRELTIQGNNAVHDKNARNALLPEVLALKESLLAAANTADGQGRFLFGGTRDGSTPFTLQSSGVVYAGDQTQRRTDVAPGIAIADTDPGSEIFQRIRTGNGTIATRTQVTNTGTGTLAASGFVNQSQWDNGSYRIVFNSGNYQVLDAASTVVASGAHTPGTSIVFRGYQATITGAPANGDTFTVTPAGTQDVFALVDRLVAALQTADTPAASGALRQNHFYAVLEDLGQAEAHLIDRRAASGARLSALDAAANERESALISTRTTLSGLRDLDYAEAVSRLSRESVALEAAQATFAKIQSMSLFNFLR